MTDYDFWQKVYIAAIRAGHGPLDARDKAEAALKALQATRW